MSVGKYSTSETSQMSTRVIRSSYRLSKKLRKLSKEAYLALPHLYCIADSFGCFILEPFTNRNQAFPSRSDITPEEFATWIAEYKKNGQLEVWKEEGTEFAYFSGWFKHNRLRYNQNPTTSRPPSLRPHITAKEWDMADKEGLERLRQRAANCGKLPPSKPQVAAEERRGEEKKGKGKSEPEADGPLKKALDKFKSKIGDSDK